MIDDLPGGGCAPEHVFCFFRTINGLPKDGTAEGFRDLAPGATPDREADELLGKLKTKLRQKLPETNLLPYQAEWIPPAISLTHLDQLCHNVEHVLSEVIRAQIARLKQEDEESKATDLDREIEQHEAFCKDRTKFFRGREGTLRRIADYLAADDPRPLALIGGPGSGKSAVLAKAVEEARTAHPDASVIFRFIGWTPGSGVVRDLLDKLCREIGPGDQPTPSEYRELVQEFPKRLKEAAQNKRLLVFLDALDQLSEADNARNLIWLPTELPANVRLVVSTSTEPGDTEAVLKRRLPEDCRFPLDDMLVEEAHDLPGMWFDDPKVDRTLQGRAETLARCSGQWKYALDQYGGCRRPLYLKLAFEEARRWRSFDNAKDTRLAADIPSLIEQLYDRLSSPANHGATIVARSLGYLVAGKNGLTEDELIDVLSRDPQVLDEVRKFHRPPEEQLPVVIWSRLYFDLEPYLTQRSADDTSLLAFYHRQLDLVARKKVPGAVQDGAASHAGRVFRRRAPEAVSGRRRGQAGEHPQALGAALPADVRRGTDEPERRHVGEALLYAHRLRVPGSEVHLRRGHVGRPRAGRPQSVQRRLRAAGGLSAGAGRVSSGVRV